MKFRVRLIIVAFLALGRYAFAQPEPGFEDRIKRFIDTLKIVDTHEHLFDPVALRQTNFLDFTMLFQPGVLDDMISSGLPDSSYNHIFNEPLSPVQKWKIVEPYWNNTSNTSFSRVLLKAANDLFGVRELNESTVGLLTSKIRSAYSSDDWFSHVAKDLAGFDYLIQETDRFSSKYDYVRYTEKFSEWITINSKYRIDSLAIMQVEPIYTLEDFVKSMEVRFDEAVKNGIVAVKVKVAYSRSLNFEKVSTEQARRVFRTLINGNESTILPAKDVKPLQDYMLHQLLQMANKNNLPVAFHTGLQAGSGNLISNSDPELLVNLFIEYPDLKFVLYHGSYPFGGTLSTLAKNFRNVYLDMNWTYAISPSYTERYLSEWLETVPASKIMAFGGDQHLIENTYGELLEAKKIISRVLSSKVREGYMTENEAIRVAKMILHDNAVSFYKLK